jgi:hypothetical protein
LGGAEFVKSAVGSVHCDLPGMGVEDELPLSFVDTGVMISTQQQKVVDVCVTAVVPGDQVMGVCPRRRGFAAGPAAAAVASVERFADPVRDDAVGAADFEG